MSQQIYTTRAEGKEILVTHIFNAPRELVWKAWTESERVKRWWGPRAFTAPYIKIDLRIGGEYLYCMRSPEGLEFWSKGTYLEIKAPERLAVTDSFADPSGNVVPATYYGLGPEYPMEMLAIILFEEEGPGKTRLTLTHFGIPEGDFNNARTGWTESFQKLDSYLGRITRTRVLAEPGKQEMFVLHEFEAPRDLVFKAFIEPNLYTQWIGPRKNITYLERFEPWSGGSWRYTQKDDEGNEYKFHGVVHEVTAPVRIIETFEYEGLPEKGHVTLQTARFEEVPGGKTRLIAQSVFQSVADRDGMLQAGMEEGVSESYERLDELLDKMQKDETGW